MFGHVFSRHQRKICTLAIGLICLICGLGLVLSACSDSTQPDRPGSDQGGAVISGSVDPGSATFVLQLQPDPIPGGPPPVPVELVGSNLILSPDDRIVHLDVALRNIGGQPLYAPAQVVVFDLVPPEITIVNADFLVDFAGIDGGPLTGGYGFDYDDFLGEDGVLEPGELSEAKNWQFHMPDYVPFSFAAHVRFGMVPDLPRIGGVVFTDRNRNGQLDPGEAGLAAGGNVQVRMPDGQTLNAGVELNGHFSVPVEQIGLHSLQLLPYVPDFTQPIFTTPNPLQVVLPPGPDGRPQSFLDARFGVFFHNLEDSIPLVVTADRPLQELHEDFYHLLRAELQGSVLEVEVGYSGCQPEHPFTLFWSGNFMESNPVQTDMLLVHHHTGELCERYMQRVLRFNLDPIMRAYIDSAGQPGTIILHLRQMMGPEHTFRWVP